MAAVKGNYIRRAKDALLFCDATAQESDVPGTPLRSVGAESSTVISSLTGRCSMMDGRCFKDVHYYGGVSEDCTLISMTGNCTLMGDVVNP